MLMEILKQLGLGATKDYLEDQSESAPNLRDNPEEMDKFLMDLVMGVSGGVGGTIKTGSGMAKRLSKLIKKLGDSKPSGAGLSHVDDLQKTLGNITNRGRGGNAQFSSEVKKTMEKLMAEQSELYKLQKWKVPTKNPNLTGKVESVAKTKGFVPEKIADNDMASIGKIIASTTLAGLLNQFKPEPKAHDEIDNLIDKDSPNFPPIPSFLGEGESVENNPRIF